MLKLVRKGVTKETHISAGLKVKAAGIQLSEYFLIGLGGTEFSQLHALESADALSRINPDFIRFRTLHLPDKITLYPDGDTRYQWAPDLVLAREVLTLIEHLHGITSRMTSDHSYNLFQEIDGTLPQDRSRLADVLRTFIAMDRKQQILFQVGKRAGYFLRLGDMPIPDGSSRCGTSAASRTSPRITPMSESTRLSRIACAGGCLFSTGCGLHGKGMEDLNLSAIMELIFPLLVLTIIVRTFIIDTYYSQEKSHALPA
ncbi:hypothetical protein [Geotalea toluenoxydans]|uniref:hypothetical protein n=1 Tax=Geotalea toluenoxydans TaxID=421624 RepID=UPI001FB2C90C|nr:hypothetical protein [Geotalea toluenoxydans]